MKRKSIFKKWYFWTAILIFICIIYFANHPTNMPVDTVVNAYLCGSVGGRTVDSFQINAGESCQTAYKRLSSGGMYDTPDSIIVCPNQKAACECYTTTGCKIKQVSYFEASSQIASRVNYNGNVFNERII